MPKTVPNQKMVMIHRDIPKKGDNNYLAIKKDHLYRAYKDLNATALVVYLYLCGNKDGYEMALSPKAIRQETGMADSTCRDQINVLISKGYLVPRKEGSNLYDFYEDPSEVRAKAEQAPAKEDSPAQFRF